MKFSPSKDTQQHRAGEGLAIGRSLLNPIDNPVINPFESDTLFFLTGDQWLVVIGSQLTLSCDENLSVATKKAIDQHQKTLSALLP
jgi:hypothetical protein